MLQKTKERILVAAPIHDSKRYIAKRYFDNVMKLIDSVHYDFLYVDNSETNEFIYDLNRTYTLNNFSIHKDPDAKGGSRERQCSSLNKIREYFLKGNYTHLFLLESDLIPNSDIIEHLLSHDKDICSAVYWIGTKKKVPMITKKEVVANNGAFPAIMVNTNFINGELKEVPNGSGLGCIIIKRKVLEKIKFRCGVCHADTYFHEDVKSYGFESWIDTSQVIAHYPSEYKD